MMTFGMSQKHELNIDRLKRGCLSLVSLYYLCVCGMGICVHIHVEMRGQRQILPQSLEEPACLHFELQSILSKDKIGTPLFMVKLLVLRDQAMPHL